MLKDVKIPEISENVTSGTIVEVLVKVGDTVAVDDVLVEMETEKAVVEIPSPYAGKISDVLVEAGDEKHVGDVIVRIETDSGAAGEKDEAGEGREQGSAATKTAKQRTRRKRKKNPRTRRKRPPRTMRHQTKKTHRKPLRNKNNLTRLGLLPRGKPMRPKTGRKPPARRPRQPLPCGAWPVNWVSISTRFAAAVATAVSARPMSTTTSRRA
jgi:pyruvate/2-oxoglutarate dehydrogenase complex dihydrolipoamide acyltransferase (E2) component